MSSAVMQSNMKKSLTIFGTAFLIFIVTPVRSEILRCDLITKLGFRKGMEMRLDIILPEENDDVYLLGTLSKNNKFNELSNNGRFRTEIQKGTIEHRFLIQGKPDSRVKPSRLDFFVTRMPSEDKGMSLVGFSMIGSHIWTIQVDVWKGNKPVYIYKTGDNEFALGECK